MISYKVIYGVLAACHFFKIGKEVVGDIITIELAHDLVEFVMHAV